MGSLVTRPAKEEPYPPWKQGHKSNRTKYNFNNDKGTQEVFGFKSGDESWEILQNGTDRVGWHSADFSGDGWKTDFEARYPKNNTNINRLKTLSEWLVSTDTGAATGSAISAVTYDGVTYTHDTVEYRLAKFSAELSNYFIEEAIIFYYLYTEMFLSIDQREKNAFPTYLADEGKWIVLFYDADSSCGTDNKGNLTFDYFLEDVDYTEGGDPVYNGQNSVLWKNLRATRYDEIMAMYQDLRTSNKVDYESVIGRFEAHQGKWPEAIFNEDMQIKCIDPLILDGDGLYLPMLQGKKEQWMKWWLYNRFRYLDSKYVTGTSMTNRITIRAHQKASVFLKSYLNMYGHVYFNAAMVEHRMVRGQEYEFEWPASGAEDPVIGINDADLLTSLGDLSPLMVELIDVSGAPHISELKIGDGAEDYANYSLNSITLGNNKLLRRLDLRNCPNLTMSPDVSGCSNIEEILCEGSSVQGIKVPDGGILKTLHLPATVVNLNIVNQPQLTDFVIPSFDQITTLRLENAGVLDAQMLDILNVMAPKGRIRLIGFTMNAENYSDITDLVAKLDTMRGLDESGNNVDYAQVSGTIYMDMITQPQLNEIAEIRLRYPGLNVVYNSIETYTVSFYNDSTLLYSVENVLWGSSVEYVGDTPVRPNANENEDWEHIGWDPEPTFVIANMICYAKYKNNVSRTRLYVQRKIDGKYEHNNVEMVDEYAFSNCHNLTSVAFGSAKTIGRAAFQSCTGLTSVYFPNVTSIATDGYAFTSCSSLTSLDFPSLKTVGHEAFTYCSSMTSINLPVLESAGRALFMGDVNLASIDLSSMTSNKIENRMFSGCKGLKSVTISINTKTIDYSSFQNCSSITVIDLPAVTTLGATMFSGCSSLEALVIRSESVCTIADTSSFSGTPIEAGRGYIYVPRSLISAYQTATNWSTIPLDQFRAIEDYTSDGTITGSIQKCNSINIDTTQLVFTEATSVEIPVTIMPANSVERMLHWSAASPQIANVNDGLITAVADGNTTITVSCGACVATIDVSVIGVKDCINILNDISFISGYISNNGSITNGVATDVYTDPFIIKDYVGYNIDIVLAGTLSQPNNCRVVFYSESGSVVGYKQGVAGNNTISVTIPENAYSARVSVNMTGGFSYLQIIDNNNFEIGRLEYLKAI